MNAFDHFFSYSKNLNKKFVLGPKEVITFQELFLDSLKIASYLNRQIGENKEVLLISSNSVFFIKVYLGLIKSGNICIPINPAIEQSNLDYVRTITDCSMVFAADDVRLVLKASGIDIVTEEGLIEILSSKDIMDPTASKSFDSERTAVILFTSGSTSFPKGVMLTHLNISSNTDSIIDYLKISETDIAGVVLPFYYCYGLSLLHTHLKAGGSLVLINDFIFLGSVINNLLNYKCTGFAGVPSHYQILLRKSTTFSITKFPHLRYVTQAGGKLHDVFIQEFLNAFPNIAFIIMYGQTEATARLAYLPPEMSGEKLGSIGKAIPGVTLEILNEHQDPVRIGEVGEIVAKGDNIMKGYYKDPDATKEALKNNWLFTGDLGKKDKDGYLYLVGRKKEIIKVGGRRVSPKEIEEVILTIPDVIDCTIEGCYDEVLGEGIKATVVLKNECDELKVKENILQACGKNLSQFKIPQIIAFQSSLKVNMSGKKIKVSSIPNL